jgi:predicted dehydrogenase
VQDYYEFPDTQYNTFEFRNGFVAHSLDCHTRAAIPEQADKIYEEQYGHQYETSLVGTVRALRYLPINRVLYVYRHERQPDGAIWQRLERVNDFSKTHSLHDVAHDTTTEIDEFLTAARAGQDTHLTPEDALQTHLVCFAAARALAERMPVEL